MKNWLLAVLLWRILSLSFCFLLVQHLQAIDLNPAQARFKFAQKKSSIGRQFKFQGTGIYQDFLAGKDFHLGLLAQEKTEGLSNLVLQVFSPELKLIREFQYRPQRLSFVSPLKIIPVNENQTRHSPGFWVLANIRGIEPVSHEVLILKFDQQANFLAEMRLNSSLGQTDSYDVAEIQEIPQGFCWIAGIFERGQAFLEMRCFQNGKLAWEWLLPMAEEDALPGFGQSFVVDAQDIYLALSTRLLKLNVQGEIVWAKQLKNSSVILSDQKLFVTHPSITQVFDRAGNIVWSLPRGGTLACKLPQAWILYNTIMKNESGSSWDIELSALDKQGNTQFKQIKDRGDQDFALQLICLPSRDQFVLAAASISRPWPFRQRREDALLLLYDRAGRLIQEQLEAAWSNPRVLRASTDTNPYLALGTLGGGLGFYPDFFKLEQIFF